MKFLVTGGCGFLGSNLTQRLISEGESVTVLDNLSRDGSARNLVWLRKHGSFEFCHGDTRLRGDVARVVKKSQPDVIFHLAGQVAMTTSVEEPAVDFDTNAGGAINVLEAVRTASPESVLVYSSTNKVYGALNSVRISEMETRYSAPDFPNGLDESLPFAPTTPYGCSKAAADLYMQDYARMYGLRTLTFRHSSMYGPRQFATVNQGWIGWFCARALEQRRGNEDEFLISGTGKQVRDVLFADDLVDLYLLVARNPDRATGGVLNVGGGMDNSLSLIELFGMLAEELGHQLRWISQDFRREDQRFFVANNNQVSEEFGWKPKTAARDGIARMLEWLVKNGD